MARRPLKFTCPDCGAPPKKRCMSDKRPGHRMGTGYHQGRLRRADGLEAEPRVEHELADAKLRALMLEFCAPLRFTANEPELAAQFEELLAAEEVEYKREYELAPEDRPDFFVHRRVAVEIKTAGSFTNVVRQISRYAEHEQVDMVLLVTTRSEHRQMPPYLSGTPVVVYWVPFCA